MDDHPYEQANSENSIRICDVCGKREIHHVHGDRRCGCGDCPVAGDGK